MDSRLLCYVNCAQPTAAWGPLRAAIEALLCPRLATPPDPAETGPFLQMQGGTVVVMDVRAPYPVRELSDDLSQNTAWPGWQQAPRDWRTHFIVAPVGKPASLANLRDAAEAVLLVAAAIAHETQADAVGWGPTGLFWPARAFVDGVARVPLNVELLVRCLWSGRQDAGGMEVTTTGLRTFGLPELNCGPSALRPEAIHDRLMSLASHLLENGAVLQDGQTLGSGDTPEAAIEHAYDGAGRLVLVVRLGSAAGAGRPTAPAFQQSASVRRPVFGRKGLPPGPRMPSFEQPAPAHLQLMPTDGRTRLAPAGRNSLPPGSTHVPPSKGPERPRGRAAPAIFKKRGLKSRFKPYADLLRIALRLITQRSIVNTNK